MQAIDILRGSWFEDSTLRIFNRGVDDWVDGKVIMVDFKDLFIEFSMWDEKWIQRVRRTSVKIRPYEHQIEKEIARIQDALEDAQDDWNDENGNQDDGLDMLFF